MPFRGDAGCFTFGVTGINKGRIGQPGADGAAFFCLKGLKGIKCSCNAGIYREGAQGEAESRGRQMVPRGEFMAGNLRFNPWRCWPGREDFEGLIRRNEKDLATYKSNF